MKTLLHYYPNKTAYEEDLTRTDFPNVSFVDYENQVYYESYSHEYLTFKSLEDSNVIYFKCDNDNYRFIKTILVSNDNGQNWTSYTASAAGTIIGTLDNGESILIKGNNDYYGSFQEGYSKNFFASTKNFEVFGNILSLVFGDDYRTQFLTYNNNSPLNGYGTFYGLFLNCTHLISAKNLIMPKAINTLYFAYKMFNGCTSLTIAPKLPATMLADRCYQYMFQGCTSLTTTPELPATTLASSCYGSMFNGCTSLTTASVLPATTLANSCYYEMFNGCTSLTTAPELPATTLANSCYGSMFNGCTSLTTAPKLPATQLIKLCYAYMFNDCTSLNSITCFATNISASNCTTSWVSNVASTGIFIKADGMNSWTTGNNGIPNGWTIENN